MMKPMLRALLRPMPAAPYVVQSRAWSTVAMGRSAAALSRTAAAVAAAAAAAAAATALAHSSASSPAAESSGWFSKSEEAAGTRLIMSGDCGGTNTRLVLFRVKDGVKAEKGKVPAGEVLLSKHYRNAENGSFTECCEKFLADADKLTGGERPKACCLACAGGIVNNTVSFTNVKDGWAIDGTALQSVLGIPKIKLINDFEAQGYGLLTLSDAEVTKLNGATPKPGAPIACVGAGTGLGECFLTASAEGTYTCWPSEGGHAEFSPRSALTGEFLEHLREKLAFDTAGTPEKMAKYFDRWDINGDGTISRAEFEEALKQWDVHDLKPRRVSVERVVSGPGLAAIYGFLRKHWAYADKVDAAVDESWKASDKDKRGAIVAQCAHRGNTVCAKAVSIFTQCYGSEVGVAALKWLPYGGLYISGGIAAKNPGWVQSSDFLDSYRDKGRMSNLVMSVPLYLVLVEDTGERGALFYAVQMLG